MPSLADRISANQKVLTRGPGGQLVEESQESVQDLAKNAGLAAPPLTPAGGAMIGANPNQQKMMGTPAQKGAALNLAATAAPDNSLQDAIRRGQVRTEASAQEQGKIQKSEDMANLGSLGDRVTDFINAQRQKLVSTQAQAQPGVAQTVTGAQGELSPEQAANVKPLLEQLAANPSNMQLQLQVNQALGYDINRQLSPEEINNLYMGATESVAKGGADVIANGLTANDLIAQGGLGYDANQLSQLLGVPADQVGSMSVQQIHDKIAQLQQDEFSQTAALEQKAQSGQLGAAERALAHQGAREASAVGIRSTEADVQHLEQQIQNADKVQFGGQIMPVDQMLSDDNISKTISDYLNAAPDSPQRQQLEKTEPQLIEFIKKNEAVLSDAAKQLSGGAQQFQDLQKSNQDVSSLGGLIPTDIAKQLVPGSDQLSAAAIDPNAVPILAAAPQDPNKKQAYAQDIQRLAELGATAELAGLTKDQINQLQLDTPGGKWSTFVDQKQKYQQIQDTPDSQIQDLAGLFFDVGTNQDYASDLKQEASNRILGIGHTSKSTDLLDANHDGTIDSGAELKKRLANQSPSLAGVLAGQNPLRSQAEYKGPQTFEFNKKMIPDLVSGDAKTTEAALSADLAKYTGDGKLDPDELMRAFGKDIAKQDSTHVRANINELKYLQSHGQLDSDTNAALQNLLHQYGQARAGGISDALADSYNDVDLKHLNAPDGNKESLTKVVERQIAALQDLDNDGQGGDSRIHKRLQDLETILRFQSGHDKGPNSPLYDDWVRISQETAKRNKAKKK